MPASGVITTVRTESKKLIAYARSKRRLDLAGEVDYDDFMAVNKIERPICDLS
jgi:hypothetical protein